MSMTIHSESSTYREKLLEHLFSAELLRHLWRRGIANVDFLRPEVDGGGYDLVIVCDKVTRHVQLKSSHRKAATSKQKINIGLQDKQSGCVVWMYFDEVTLELGPFLWYGGLPGEPLPDIKSLPIARHTKGNAQGEKAPRPNIREPEKGFVHDGCIHRPTGRPAIRTHRQIVRPARQS